MEIMDVWQVGLFAYVCGLSLIQGTKTNYIAPTHTLHNHEELTSFLHDVHRHFPDMTHLYSIGKSVQERELWVMALAGSSPDRHVLLRPEVKYVGNMHGNEVVSRELMIQFINHLVTTYGVDNDVTELLNKARVHVMVSMNPDGFEKALEGQDNDTCLGVLGRYNANNWDLNRNFPDYFWKTREVEIQPETRAVMNWIHNMQFVLSANLHGGALLVSYPYDNTEGSIHEYSMSPDDDVFRHLAMTYSSNHADMSVSTECGNFTDGITNGAEWYPINGSMQDYNYIEAGCMEVTLEVACCKYPNASNLEPYWLDNKDALMAYLQQAQIGVKGIVKDLDGKPVKHASVTVAGREEHDVKTTKDGEFWRLLLPGDYTLQVRLEEENATNQTMFTVLASQLVVLDITLPITDEVDIACKTSPTWLLVTLVVMAALFWYD